jgi:AcrR family transcriptional regulator
MAESATFLRPRQWQNADVSLREVKKERTRQTIADVAAQLFARHGFDAVTVADIARAADVAPRTVHRYFPDKQELLFAEDGEFRKLITGALTAAPPDASGADLVAGVLALLVARLEGRRPAAVARQRLIESSPALRARDITKHAAIEDLIAEHLARRWGVTTDSDVRPRWWAGAGLACFFSAYRVWLAEGGRLQEHVDRAVRLLPPGP